MACTKAAKTIGSNRATIKEISTDQASAGQPSPASAVPLPFQGRPRDVKTYVVLSPPLKRAGPDACRFSGLAVGYPLAGGDHAQHGGGMHWLYIYRVDVIRATASFFMENDRWKFTELSKSAATHTQLKLQFAA